LTRMNTMTHALNGHADVGLAGLGMSDLPLIKPSVTLAQVANCGGKEIVSS